MNIQITKQPAEQSNRKILVLLDNLFFAAKINQAASGAGVEISYAKTSTRALEIARNEHPALIIIDLDASACSPFDLIADLKSDEELRAVPTLGFVSHVNTKLREQARIAGCDRILARSVFDRNLADLLNQFFSSSE